MQTDSQHLQQKCFRKDTSSRFPNHHHHPLSSSNVYEVGIDQLDTRYEST